MQSRCIDRFLDIPVEPQVEHGHLRHAGGDLRPTASTEYLLHALIAVLQQNEGRHRRDRPLAGLDEISRTGGYAKIVDRVRDGEIIHVIVVDDVRFRAEHFRSVASRRTNDEFQRGWRRMSVLEIHSGRQGDRITIGTNDGDVSRAGFHLIEPGATVVLKAERFVIAGEIRGIVGMRISLRTYSIRDRTLSAYSFDVRFRRS